MSAAMPASRTQRCVYAIARELAMPVAKGLLSGAQAEAALLVCAIRQARAGRLGRDPVDVAECARHVLRLHVDQILTGRLVTADLIRRAIEPLIGIRAPGVRIRQTAQQVNAAADCPLGTWEAEEVAEVTVWLAMNQVEGHYA